MKKRKNRTIVYADDISPWYHCKKCIDSGVNLHYCRLSTGDKFCGNCGNKLDWKTDVENISKPLFREF